MRVYVLKLYYSQTYIFSLCAVDFSGCFYYSIFLLVALVKL